MSTTRKLRNVPIRYGRPSDSRGGQFTMVFVGKKHGTAKVTNLKNPLPVENGRIPEATAAIFAQEVDALAKAEGIRKGDDRFHSKGWGVVAVGINPRSPLKKQLRELWLSSFKPHLEFNPAGFRRGVVDGNGFLRVKLPWASRELAGVDFCLATPTKPARRLPTPRAIAAAVAPGSGSYFRRTVESGIVTADDAEIKRILARMDATA